jgi:hypothetical protein
MSKTNIIQKLQLFISNNFLNPINQLETQQINEINYIISNLFNFNDPINQQYQISNKELIHQQFIQCIQSKYQNLFDDIFKYRIQVSKNDIYTNIQQLIRKQYSYNTNTIYLLWNYDYGMAKSVINYNLLFLNNLYQLYTNQLYITNFTPESLKTGDEINDPVDLSNLNITKYQHIFYHQHIFQQYFIFDDISYSGTQLMEDCKKWFDYIITNFSDYLNSDQYQYQYTLNIFLYGITLNAYQSYLKFILYLQTLEQGHFINKSIIFSLNYHQLFYSSIPIVFKKYIQIKYPNIINSNLDTKLDNFYDIPLKYLKQYQNTMNILNQLSSNDLILFGDFYFANEMNEYLFYHTKRLQTLIYLDYKIPDTRSINDRLFYGFVPIYFLNQSCLYNYQIVGTFNNNQVYQLKLFDVYKPFLSNYIFKMISNIPIRNTSRLIDANIEKPLKPWYKI